MCLAKLLLPYSSAQDFHHGQNRRIHPFRLFPYGRAGHAAAAAAFYLQMSKRRSVRDFSDKPIPLSVIEHAILAAGSAPSGANMQPWHFVVVRDAAIKQQIRQAAEVEERELYATRASDEWLECVGASWNGC